MTGPGGPPPGPGLDATVQAAVEPAERRPSTARTGGLLLRPVPFWLRRSREKPQVVQGAPRPRMAAVPRPRPRWLSPPLALALVAAAGLEAAGLTLGPLPSQLPVSPDLGTAGGQGPGTPAARLAELDVTPVGRHGLRVHVALAATGDEAADGLEVRVQAVDEAGGILAAAERGPVTAPAEGRWSADLRLTGPGLVEDWAGTRVAVEPGGRRPPLP